jgi:hypothetical protein
LGLAQDLDWVLSLEQFVEQRLRVAEMARAFGRGDWPLEVLPPLRLLLVLAERPALG